MKKVQHSNLPWRVQPCAADLGKSIVIAGSGRIGVIALIQYPEGGYTEDMGISRNQDEANAAFIVRACNAHEDLVEALNAALPELDGLNSIYAENAARLEMSYMGIPALDKVRSVLAALAKAEGR